MSASVKSLLSTLTVRGPHRVLRGNLAIAGQPGVVYTPETGRDLPAVAFGHGWLTGQNNYRALLEHLASWGIVTAAPDTERGPVPSHRGLATDLLTTLDICTGVRLGDGTITVHPERLALAGHGMGAGAAVLAAAQRRVAAVAALFPAPTSPAAESVAPDIDTPALIIAGSGDIDSHVCNAVQLACAWGGPSLLRALDHASRNGLVEGRWLPAALGGDKHEVKTTRLTRALLTGYLLHTLLGDKTYAPFTDPATKITRTHVLDPEVALAAAEEEGHQPPALVLAQLLKTLRK